VFGDTFGSFLLTPLSDIVRKVDLRIGKDVVIESKKRGDKAGI
jgi:hypothetical protein